MKDRRAEALELSEEILANFEMGDVPTHNIIFKMLRLARLLGDMEAVNWLGCEANGFVRTPDGLPPDDWSSAIRSGRTSLYKEKGELKVEAFTETVSAMEAVVAVSKQRMEVTRDPHLSLTGERMALGNSFERQNIADKIQQYTERISTVKGTLYKYALAKNYELKFGSITQDIFAKKRDFVDHRLAKACPDAVKMFVSVWDNLQSQNAEDWANAVHSCRRILKAFADAVYPPRTEPVIVDGKSVKVGEEQYINRLIQHVASKSTSDSFNSIVGSHLAYIGERLDSIYNSTNKGTHARVSVEEAERYTIYTYLLLGDILSL